MSDKYIHCRQEEHTIDEHDASLEGICGACLMIDRYDRSVRENELRDQVEKLKMLAIEKKAIAFDLAWRKEHDGETLCCVCEVPGRWLASHDDKAYCATCLANQLAAEVAERDAALKLAEEQLIKQGDELGRALARAESLEIEVDRKRDESEGIAQELEAAHADLKRAEAQIERMKASQTEALSTGIRREIIEANAVIEAVKELVEEELVLNECTELGQRFRRILQDAEPPLTIAIERIDHLPPLHDITLMSEIPWGDQGGAFALYRYGAAVRLYVAFHEQRGTQLTVYRLNVEEAAIKVLEKITGKRQDDARRIMEERDV